MGKRKGGLSSLEERELTSEDFFTNADAQAFAFDVVTRGVDTLHREIELEPRRRNQNIRRTLAACEVVAAANGHPPAASGWCTMLEMWLFESKYTPAPATVGLAARRARQIASFAAGNSALAIPRENLKGLLHRLQKSYRKIDRKAVRGDRPAFRALARWLNTSQGEVDDGPQFDRSGNARVILTYLTINASCKLINYPMVRRLELWLNNQNDRKELAASVKILLRGWRTTLEALEFDHVVDLTIRRTPAPFRTLVECKEQLADLPALQRFSSANMYFDDTVLEHVCRNGMLQEITISNAQLSRRALNILGNCKRLEGAYISRCSQLNRDDEAKLQQHLPRATVSISDR
jgi:hypothetical protein